jgi:O-antigen/teichoic acid export membrane protein
MTEGAGRATPAATWRRATGPLIRLLSGVGAAALATYVYLIVVARAVGPAEYAAFSAFWAVVVIAGTGVYLPIEQETARRAVDPHGRSRPRPLRRSAYAVAAVVTAGLAVLLLLLWPAVAGFFDGDTLLALAVVAGCVGYAAQYPARGLLSARRQYGRYAAVLGSEALLRVVLVLALVTLAEPGPGVLAAVVGVAACGSAVVGLVGAGSGEPVDAAGARALLRSGAVLIVGAVALQTLLYGGVLVARILAPAAEEAAAGQLLAAITVTRIPVFLFQSLEALVVPRIAELAARGDVPGLRLAVRRLLALVGSLAVTAAAGAALVGPQLVRLLFGAAYDVSHTTMGLLGLGTGVFMVAVAASDVTVSLRGHRQVAVGWVAGLAVAALSVLVFQDFLARVTGPLIVGSAVVAVVLGIAARTRIAATLPAAA